MCAIRSDNFIGSTITVGRRSRSDADRPMFASRVLGEPGSCRSSFQDLVNFLQSLDELLWSLLP